jgi:hypothetical protein
MTQMPKIGALIGLSVAALLFLGCGKKEEPAPPETPGAPESATPAESPTPVPPTAGRTADSPPAQMPDMAAAAARTEQALQQANQGQVVEAAAPGTMKEMLPAELPGMKRTDVSAERTQMGGVDISTANAQYDTESGDASIHIAITDTGNLSGPMRMGLASWAMAQYSRETDTGYEKTTTYAGYKAVEEYDTQSKDGVLRVFVADRFVVEVNGSQTTMEVIKQAMDRIDLKKLAALK